MIKISFAAAFAALSFSATAQGTFESTGLGQVDPWGVGSLSRSEGALPNTLWQNSDAQLLMNYFSRAKPSSASPVGKDLLARAMRSSARRPAAANADKLFVHRLRILQELGYTEDYAELLRQAPSMDGIPSYFEHNLDMQFARGNLNSACSSARASSGLEKTILTARAVCFALEGDLDSAQLALEFAQNEGQNDPWYVAAIGAAILEIDGPKPAPKLNTGLNMALSLAADLPIGLGAVSTMRPDLASELIKRRDVPRNIRILAADRAALSGQLSLEDYVAAYRLDPVVTPTVPEGDVEQADKPVETPRTDPNKPVNELDSVLQKLNDPEVAPPEKTAALARALTLSRSTLERYRLTARTLQPYLARITLDETFDQYAELFVLSSTVAGDNRTASRFLRYAEREGGPESDEFLTVWLDGLAILSGQDRSPQSSIIVSSRLAEIATEETRSSISRMLHLFSAFDAPLSPEARKFLANIPGEVANDGQVESWRQIFQTGAAFQSEAIGEGVLRTTFHLQTDPAVQRVNGVIQVIEVLRNAGLDQDARNLALEAVKFYNPRG